MEFVLVPLLTCLFLGMGIWRTFAARRLLSESERQGSFAALEPPRWLLLLFVGPIAVLLMAALLSARFRSRVEPADAVVTMPIGAGMLAFTVALFAWKQRRMRELQAEPEARKTMLQADLLLGSALAIMAVRILWWSS